MLTRCKEHAHRHSSRDVLIPKCSHFVCSRHLRSSAGDECPTLCPSTSLPVAISTQQHRLVYGCSLSDPCTRRTDISCSPNIAAFNVSSLFYLCYTVHRDMYQHGRKPLMDSGGGRPLPLIIRSGEDIEPKSPSEF